MIIGEYDYIAVTRLVTRSLCNYISHLRSSHVHPVFCLTYPNISVHLLVERGKYNNDTDDRDSLGPV